MGVLFVYLEAADIVVVPVDCPHTVNGLPRSPNAEGHAQVHQRLHLVWTHHAQPPRHDRSPVMSHHKHLVTESTEIASSVNEARKN